ncbi:2-dehydro-3-deoxygalactonokinase [Lacisediminimonas sp.]|uniref:2-dehydro-3-deoxygalactonokinase n=1 Tax=Lacisediminimonas sp. TaxID=3060582 RepID=UPI00271C6B4B|nr:2-dehydro-3-deoxygalactonokinase [Lacisediminimonas sp.]MDO8298834.1 2-dehydro-3-deoxygalactonokinase [Lacisediminimonas sp.]MDO9216240.1 2-dehydro-3-deoxygalactonokinase [Lacisediminimonas sp.]
MASGKQPILGIDWGTTNRRAYLLDEGGEIARLHADDQGILAVKGDFARSLRELLASMQVRPAQVLMSGMVGSRNGWRDVPYLDTIHPLHRLPAAMLEIDSKLPGVSCRIVPGYRATDDAGMPDVMRGEETQILGALASGAPEGWFVLPGTHCKWVHVAQDRIRHLLTFMTGELFALLSERGTLAALMQHHAADVPEAFLQGLEAAASGPFTHRAFSCRALVVTDQMPASHAASWLSGLLIGCELQEIQRRAEVRGVVQVVGSEKLAERYALALRHIGLQARCWQPDAVYVAALRILAAGAMPQPAASSQSATGEGG